MLRQMERSTLHLLAKRGKSVRQIAAELGRNRRTITRARREPVDQQPARRHRPSQVDPFRPQIAQWLQDNLSIVRMLELARADPDHPYTGGDEGTLVIIKRTVNITLMATTHIRSKESPYPGMVHVGALSPCLHRHDSITSLARDATWRVCSG